MKNGSNIEILSSKGEKVKILCAAIVNEGLKKS